MKTPTGDTDASSDGASAQKQVIQGALREADGDIRIAAYVLGVRPRGLGSAMSEIDVRTVDLRGVSHW